MKGLICSLFFLFASSMAQNPTCEFGQQAAKESGQATSQLAIKLYQKIIAGKPNSNVVFSPVSIALALALVESGASGSTRAEIQRLLAPIGSNQIDSSNLYESLQHQLQIYTNQSIVSIANGFFYSDKGLQLNEDYLLKVRNCFQTEVSPEPFSSNPEQARQSINQWVSTATVQKIPQLFGGGSIDRETLAVLANAIYLKAAWDNHFAQFENLPFYASGNQAKTVSFMRQQETYRYGATENLQVVGLPYAQVPLTMYIILPKQRQGIQSVEKSLTGDLLKSLLSTTIRQEVNLKLPKFTFSLSSDLKMLLQQLGVQQMFTNRADFSGIAERGLRISGAVHEAYIKVNENGTEAAAATGFSTVPLLVPAPPPEVISVVADHPFIFTIVHEPTSAVLFFGKLNSIDQ